MYHYVRPVDDSQLRYLALEDFKNQLDWLAKYVGNFLTESEWDQAKAGKPQSGVLLTFDDGLKDHVEHVLPILVERNIFGIFFVNTSPLHSNVVLPVHLAHKLLSLGKSHEILGFLEHKLPQEIWKKLEKGAVGNRYKRQEELTTNVTIKKIINYMFFDFNLPEILDSAVQQFLDCSIADLSSNWYLSAQDIQRIDSAGMRIGSHTSSHRLLSKLQRSDIYSELNESKISLEQILGKTIDEFCYPYGGADSYNQDVKDILSELKYTVAHDVSGRKFSEINFQNRYEIPRFDCNQFPFGKAHSLKV